MTEDPTRTADSPAAEHLRVAIADSRVLFAESLAALIRTMKGFEVVDVLAGAEEVPALLAREPGVLLIGTGADLTGAFSLVRSLRQIALNVEIVLLADVLTPELVRFVLDQRLSGLILTDTPASDLAACLGRVASGHAVLPADWQTVLATHGDDPVESLSDRQREVLRLAAEGHSYEEIGRRLFISSNTVKFHLRSIYLRLGVRNRMAAARMLGAHDSPEIPPVVGPPKPPRAEGTPPPRRPFRRD